MVYLTFEVFANVKYLSTLTTTPLYSITAVYYYIKLSLLCVVNH